MKLENAELRRLGDFTTDVRVLLIAAISILVASAAVLAGIGLLSLIRLVTNVAYFGKFSLATPNIAEFSARPRDLFRSGRRFADHRLHGPLRKRENPRPRHS